MFCRRRVSLRTRLLQRIPLLSPDQYSQTSRENETTDTMRETSVTVAHNKTRPGSTSDELIFFVNGKKVKKELINN